MTDRSKIPRASFVFIDSNIFTYFLLRDADFFEKCSRFLKNIVISETLFNFVKAEICKNHGLKLNEFIRYVKENPESIGEVDVSDVIDVFERIAGIKVWKPETL